MTTMDVTVFGGRLAALFGEMKRLAMMDGKTPIELALKTAEEVGELAEATLCYAVAPGTKYKALDKKSVDHLVEEAADVMLCAAAVAIKTSGSVPLLLTKLEIKMEKWERVIKEVR